MTREEFKEKLSRLKIISSEGGNKYTDLSVEGDRLSFRREGEFVNERIPVQELFDFYISRRPINGNTARDFIPENHQLPAVDILKALPSQNEREDYHEFHSETTIQGERNQSPAAEEFESPSSDERRFFSIFSEILDRTYLRSRSLGSGVTPVEVFLSNNYKDYVFSREIEDIYARILEALLADGRFSSQDITAYADGVILKHPQLKNRLIAFDEEEHFTPARRDSLLILSSRLELGFRDRYISLCSNLDYLRHEVFGKYRIDPETLAGLPETFARFAVWLQSAGEETSGHLEKETAFGFGGGRIAQRAYYDSLIDTAHLSEKNPGFEPPIRFSKKSFEEIAGIRFSGISDEKMKEVILHVMKEDYQLTF